MSKAPYIVLLLAATFSAVSASAQNDSTSMPPNILFIMVDDLGKDWIGCYGADDSRTPHIDALAAGGLKFTSAWSMPQCTPTRVTLLTGQYPWRTGWVNHWDVPRWGVGYFDWRHYTTFATMMKSAGYATAIAGKWQINDFRVEPEALAKHGFDEWCVWTGYETGNPASAERYWDAYIHTNDGSRTYEGQFGPDVYANFLIDFMARHHDDQPMMLYWPMALTHGPLVHTPSDPFAKTNGEKMQAMVSYTDELAGRLVAAIDLLGLRERTIVIFTTDNGSDGGMRGSVGGVRPTGGKGAKYEGGVCEPFIVNCPGRVPAGTETDALTDFTDLLPTFAELGGAQLPANVAIDGHSIAQLILGQTDDSPREWIMALGHGPAKLDEQGVRGVADFADRVIRDKHFKAWVEQGGGVEALYDLKNDPWERTNLLATNESRSREDVAAALTKFQAVLDSQPKQDARPKYTKRGPLPWDRKLSSAESN